MDAKEKFTNCAVDGCERNAHNSVGGARGMCKRHYGAWYRYGDPLAPERLNRGELLVMRKSWQAVRRQHTHQ